MTYEQLARDIMERCGWEQAQQCTASDVVELANLLAEVERLRTIEKNLRDANRCWEEESKKLRECLRAAGSDGSPYDSVFSEAIALLTHWRSEMDRFGPGYWEQKTEIERLQSERDEARNIARRAFGELDEVTKALVFADQWPHPTCDWLERKEQDNGHDGQN